MTDHDKTTDDLSQFEGLGSGPAREKELAANARAQQNRARVPADPRAAEAALVRGHLHSSLAEFRRERGAQIQTDPWLALAESGRAYAGTVAVDEPAAAPYADPDDREAEIERLGGVSLGQAPRRLTVGGALGRGGI